MIIGITGGIGSGKSTVVQFFSELGNIAIYEADKEAKKLMNTSQDIKKKIIAEFSDKSYINNKLNREFIASIVFKNKEKLATLNAIVHPVVHKHFQSFVKKYKKSAYILYENAILFENGSDEFCDKIITVMAPEHTRIERVSKRDNTTTEAIKNRIKNQWIEDKKTLQSHYVIQNDDLNSTRLKVVAIHKKICAFR